MPEIGVSLRPVGGSVVVGQARDHTLTIDRPKVVHNWIRDAITVRFTHEWR